MNNNYPSWQLHFDRWSTQNIRFFSLHLQCYIVLKCLITLVLDVKMRSLWVWDMGAHIGVHIFSPCFTQWTSRYSLPNKGWHMTCLWKTHHLFKKHVVNIQERVMQPQLRGGGRSQSSFFYIPHVHWIIYSIIICVKMQMKQLYLLRVP